MAVGFLVPAAIEPIKLRCVGGHPWAQANRGLQVVMNHEYHEFLAATQTGTSWNIQKKTGSEATHTSRHSAGWLSQMIRWWSMLWVATRQVCYPSESPQEHHGASG